MARNKFLKRIRRAAKALRRILICGSSTKVEKQSIESKARTITQNDGVILELPEPELSLVPIWKNASKDKFQLKTSNESIQKARNQNRVTVELPELELSLMPIWKNAPKGIFDWKTAISAEQSWNFEEQEHSTIFLGPEFTFLKWNVGQFQETIPSISMETTEQENQTLIEAKRQLQECSLIPYHWIGMEELVFFEKKNPLLEFFTGTLMDVSSRIYRGLENLLVAADIDDRDIQFVKSPYKEGIQFHATAPGHRASCLMEGANVHLVIERLYKKYDTAHRSKTVLERLLFVLENSGLALVRSEERTYY